MSGGTSKQTTRLMRRSSAGGCLRNGGLIALGTIKTDLATTAIERRKLQDIASLAALERWPRQHQQIVVQGVDLLLQLYELSTLMATI
jgi:hypothetical protein